MYPKRQNRVAGTRLMAEVKAVNQDAARFELFTGSYSATNLSFYHNWDTRSSGENG